MPQSNFKFIFGLIFLLSFLSPRIFGQSQNFNEVENSTFEFKNPSKEIQLENYRLAFKTAQLNSYRMQYEDFIMKFDSGLEVIVYSAQKLVKQGLLTSKDLGGFPIKFSYERFNSVFKLSENNYIIELREPINYSKSKSQN